MMTPGQYLTLLVQGMAQDRQSYQQLRQLLDDQRTLLLARDAVKLIGLNEALMEHYQILSASASQRQQLLRALKVNPDKPGLMGLFARLPEDQRVKVSALWASLENLASECQHLNERNGIVLHMQQEIMGHLVNADRPDAFLY